MSNSNPDGYLTVLQIANLANKRNKIKVLRELKKPSEKKLRQELQQKYFMLMGGKCSICSLVDDICVYDYHHVEASTKSATIANLLAKITKEDSKYIVLLEEELKKCVLICSHCHRKLHSVKN